MLGWGFDDLPEFFVNPARAGLVVLVLAGGVRHCAPQNRFSPVTRRFKARWKTEIATGRSSPAMPDPTLVPAFCRSQKDSDVYPELLALFRSSALRASACVSVFLALRALGQQFSAYVTLQPDHRLVRDGIYSYIRHPLYLSLLLAPAGIALVFSSYLALPVQIMAAVFVFDRTAKEEHLLAIHFGPEFEDYRRRTWRLVPHVL